MQPKQQDRGAIAPHDWLISVHTLSIGSLSGSVIRDTTMLTIMQYFGWRSNTVVSLKTADVVVVDTGIRIYTSVFKTLGPGGLPCGFLRLSQLPTLFDIVRYYIENTRSEMLFANLGSKTPSDVCQQALKNVCDFQRHIPPQYQTHGVKRGTVSVLHRLKMSIEDINLHVGWALYSKSFETYRRFVMIEPIDRQFFHDLLV